MNWQTVHVRVSKKFGFQLILLSVLPQAVAKADTIRQTEILISSLSKTTNEYIGLQSSLFPFSTTSPSNGQEHGQQLCPYLPKISGQTRLRGFLEYRYLWRAQQAVEHRGQCFPGNTHCSSPRAAQVGHLTPGIFQQNVMSRADPQQGRHQVDEL